MGKFDKNVYNWDAVKKIHKRDGVYMQILSSSTMTMCMNTLQKKALPALHSHPHEQMTYILTGTCDFRMEDEILKLKAGDVVIIPSNAQHSLKVTSDEDVLNLDVFYPVRQDYEEMKDKTS
jgi:quercetin dioxygenase-like cupin family protein